MLMFYASSKKRKIFAYFFKFLAFFYDFLLFFAYFLVFYNFYCFGFLLLFDFQNYNFIFRIRIPEKCLLGLLGCLIMDLVSAIILHKLHQGMP